MSTWDEWETTVLGHILARSLSAADFGNLAPCPLELLGKGRFGPNPGQEPVGSRFGQFGAFQPAIEIAFWNPCKTALLGQILARSLLEQDFATLAPVGRLLTWPSGIIRTRPFWAKSWPAAFWSQILAFRSCFGSVLGLFSAVLNLFLLFKASLGCSDCSSSSRTPGGPPGSAGKVLGFRVCPFDTQRLDRLYGVRQASCLALAFSSPSLTWAARSGALRSLAERSNSFGLSRGGSEPSARL